MQNWAAVLLLCILASAPACASSTSGKRALLQSKPLADWNCAWIVSADGGEGLCALLHHCRDACTLELLHRVLHAMKCGHCMFTQAVQL